MGVNLPAFQILVDAHWRDVARLAHALAGPADGDDVAQQTWAKALAAYPRLRSAANLRSWLLTITAHCALDSRRAAARSPLLVGDLTSLDAAGPPASGPQDTGDPLWVAVRRLPERQRAAIALRYIADLSHAQIAQALGTTPGASRRLVSDALAALRGELSTPPQTTPARPTPEDRS